MKKIIISFWILVSFASLAFPQSLSLSYQGVPVSNDSVYLTSDITEALIEWHLKVKNLTDKEIDVKVKKNEISLVENTINTFCWGGFCFLPTVYISPVSTKIEALSSDYNSFAGDFEPSGMEGTSIISYTFYNTQNEDDSVMVTAFYQVGTSGIQDININSNSVKVYPNPVVDQLSIVFQEEQEKPYSIRLMDLSGKLIKELVNNSMAREQTFSIEKLPASYVILDVVNSKGLIVRKKLLIAK